MKTLEELADVACKAVKTITDETTNTAEAICVLALMQTSLQQGVTEQGIERKNLLKVVKP